MPRPWLRPRVLALCFATSVLAVRADGQQAQVPTFRTGVTRVLVDALVLDSDGNPMQDLTRDDFTIYEDGVPQTIATFDVTDWTSYVAEKTAPEAVPTTSPVNTYPRRFIFVLNRQAADFDHLVRAKRALQGFVVDSMAEGDEAMVIDLAYSWKVAQEFSAVKEETIETIRRLSQMTIDWPMGPDRAARENYRGLEELGDALAELPGRKVLVFMSVELLTFPMVGTRYSSEGHSLAAAVESLNRANTTVYTIDLHGVESRPSNVGGLSPLATETGGRFFPNSVRFARPLDRIGRENQRYYLLSYTPENTEQDGTYRRIEVRVSRPGAEVIARQGYFARPSPVSTTDAASPESVTEGDARSPALPDAVEVRTYLLPTGTGQARVPVVVALPEELLSGRGGTGRTLTVTVAREGGEVLHRFEQDVSLERYYLMENVDLEPGLYSMEMTLTSDEGQLYQASTGLRVPRDFGRRFGVSSIVPVVSPAGASSVGAGLPILPTASVERDEDAYVLFQIFSDSESPSERAHVSFTISDGNGAVVRSQDNPEPVSLTDGGLVGTPVVMSLPTRGLPAGVYLVEVEVEDRSLGRRAAGELELTIR